jgi:hypothetical protein
MYILIYFLPQITAQNEDELFKIYENEFGMVNFPGQFWRNPWVFFKIHLRFNEGVIIVYFPGKIFVK